MARVRV